MSEQIDLQLSQDQFVPNYEVNPTRQYALDEMLQPITTQQKFNIKKSYPNNSIQVQVDNQNKTQTQKVQFNRVSPRSNNQSKYQDQQSINFRHYLNEKVNQLKRSKQVNKQTGQTTKQINSKHNNLRNIINDEGRKSKQNQKFINSKPSRQLQNVLATQMIKQINAKKVILPQADIKSTSAYKDMKTTSNKKFSNSHSYLSKDNKQEDKQKKHILNMKQLKRSADLDTGNSKTPKLPSLTPTLKPPLPYKQKQISQRDVSLLKKSTNIKKVQKQQVNGTKTADEKNSFRIKRSLNQNKQSQIQTVSNKKIQSIQSNKTIQRQDKKRSNTSMMKQTKQVIRQHKQIKQTKQTFKPNKQIIKQTKQTFKPNKQIIRQTKQLNIGKQRKQISPAKLSKQKQASKKLRQQFMRLNQQQKRLQVDIFKYHNQSKHKLQKMIIKYDIKTQLYQKYGIKKLVYQPKPSSHKQNLMQSKITQVSKLQKSPSKHNIQMNEDTQSALKTQQKFNKELNQEISKIQLLLKSKLKQTNKLQNKVQRNPYIQFLKSMPDDILEEDQQQQNDQVQDLQPHTNYDNHAFGSTYSEVMTEMRKKKWGLKQRTTFETPLLDKSASKISKITSINKQSSLTKQISEFTANKSNLSQQNEINNNKIEVNSRLKNLLLD